MCLGKSQSPEVSQGGFYPRRAASLARQAGQSTLQGRMEQGNTSSWSQDLEHGSGVSTLLPTSLLVLEKATFLSKPERQLTVKLPSLDSRCPMPHDGLVQGRVVLVPE